MDEAMSNEELDRIRKRITTATWQDVDSLLAEIARLKEELIEVYDTAMRGEAYLIPDDEGKHAGWWDSMASSDACYWGERLVELGKWERKEGGHGRRQFYRPITEEKGLTDEQANTP